MNTKPLVLFMLALAMGGLMWQMAGFSTAIQANGPGDNIQSSDEFEAAANDSAAQQGVDGSVDSSSDNLVGLAINGIGSVVGLFSFVGLLPFELAELGLPWWAAWPIGLGGWTLLSIMFVQFSSGRSIR